MKGERQFRKIELAEVSKVLEQLQLQGESIPFFQQEVFLRVWINTYMPENGELFLMVAEDLSTQQITHFFPYFIKKEKKFGVPYRCLALVLEESVGANYLKAMIGSQDKAVWDDFLRSTRSAWDILFLNMIDESTREFVSRDPLTSSQFLSQHLATSCPVVETMDSLDALFARIPSSKRKKFQKYLRKFDSMEGYGFKILKGDEISNVLPRIIEISTERFKKKNIQGAFLDQKFTEFHLQLLKERPDLAQFSVMTLNDQIQAFDYCFVVGNEIWMYQGGFAQECESLSPGIVNILLTMRHTCIDGKGYVFDFLEGQELYKYDFSPKENHLYQIVYSGKHFWSLALKFRAWAKSMRKRIQQKQVAKPEHCTPVLDDTVAPTAGGLMPGHA